MTRGHNFGSSSRYEADRIDREMVHKNRGGHAENSGGGNFDGGSSKIKIGRLKFKG